VHALHASPVETEGLSGFLLSHPRGAPQAAFFDLSEFPEASRGWPIPRVAAGARTTLRAVTALWRQFAHVRHATADEGFLIFLPKLLDGPACRSRTGRN